MSEVNKMGYAKLLRELKDTDGTKIESGIHDILEKEKDTRPGFSYTWINTKTPPDGDRCLEYDVQGNTVYLYRLPGETEDLYYIMPPEYLLSEKESELIYLVKKSLSEQYPRDIDLSDPNQVKKYISSRGKKLIKRTADRKGIDLADKREDEIKRIGELTEILTKYTAGLGILETFLSDPNVEDIYVDAPSVDNNVYVELGGIEEMKEKCRTNIYFSRKDLDSFLSHLRSKSGKPFSEAFPVLETDLSGYETRATVIGEPLSPDGKAFALRRRDKEPWTLPKLIAADSLTPLAAGLLSFLIDGKSTILVAGSRGAGKTTLLGALMLEFPKSQRILTIEDTRELPSQVMQELDYNIQSMLVDSSLEEGGMTADDALRVSLRLGESSMVLGEVRGQEARTLYEAMRAGTAGSSVMGTIHGNTPKSVYERVVHDMGISKQSFAATDIIAIAGLIRPGGVQSQKRRVTHISEYDDEEFFELMEFDGELQPTQRLKMHSKKIGEIASSWGMSYEKAVENIKLRAYIKKKMVECSRKKGTSLLGARWVSEANGMFSTLIEKYPRSEDYAEIKDEWTRWFEKRIKYE